MSIPVVIQAGGQGARLRPYTAILPKPLMPVDDMPILEIVVRQLAYYGFNDLYITTGHLAHLIESFFGDGSHWNTCIRYVREDQPLGTIGPVRKLPRFEQSFIVMNGDLLTDIDYRALYDYHQAHDNLVTVAVHRGEIPVSLGVIEFNDDKRIVNFQEKPSLYFWGSMGIYVFSAELWDLIPPNTYYGFDSLMADMLARNHKAEVFPWQGLWLDLGRPEDYERATDDFLQYRARFLPPDSDS